MGDIFDQITEQAEASKGDIFDSLETLPTPQRSSDEFLKGKLRYPGAFVKGAAKGVASIPRLAQTLPISLANLLTPEGAPFKQAIQEKLAGIQKTPLEEIIGKRLEKQFSTAPEEEKFEEAGGTFGESIGMGINPLLALLGAGARQAVKEGGGGEGAQLLAELAALSSPSIVKAATKGITKETIKGTSGLPKLRGENKKVGLLVEPKITERRFEKLKNKYTNQATETLNQIKGKALPAVNFDTASSKLLKEVEATSKNINQVFPGKEIANRVESKITSFQEGITPTLEDQATSKFLSQRARDLGDRDIVSVEELVKQFRNNNKDVKTIYEKFNLSEADKGNIKGAIEYNNIIKDVFKKDLVSEPEFNKIFEESNWLFAQEKKLEKFENISSDFFEEGKLDANKFQKGMNNEKNIKQLNRILGKDNTNKLRELSGDLNKISLTLDEVNKFNKTPKVLKIMKGLTSILGLIPSLPSPIGKIAIARETLSRLLGIVYSSPQKSRQFNNFFKLLKENKIPQAIKAAKGIEEMLSDIDDNKDIFDSIKE